MKGLLNISEAAEYLNVSHSSLHKWERSGKITSIKTAGGHRRYKMTDLNKFMGIVDEIDNEDSKINNNVVIYARCSSHDQKAKGDLTRQSERLNNFAVAAGYDVLEVIEDVGSGLNENRRGFKRLCKLVMNGEVSKVIIEHKDRLTRFMYEFIVTLFKQYNTEVVIVNNDNEMSEKTYEMELAEDMMMLIASFSGKLYSARGRQNKQVK